MRSLFALANGAVGALRVGTLRRNDGWWSELSTDGGELLYECPVPQLRQDDVGDLRAQVAPGLLITTTDRDGGIEVTAFRLQPQTRVATSGWVGWRGGPALNNRPQ